MFEMRSKLLIGVGVAVAGLGLLAFADANEESRGGVVLNPNPPQAPTSGLTWDLGRLPNPAGAEAGPPPPAAPADAGEPARQNADPPAEAGPVEDPYAG